MFAQSWRTLCCCSLAVLWGRLSICAVLAAPLVWLRQICSGSPHSCGHGLARRAAVLVLPFVLLGGDERTDALDALAPFASALSNGDAGAVLAAIPRDAPELRANVTALIARSEVTSSVEVLSAEQDSAELDWYLQIKNRTTQSVVETRRGKVQIRHRRRKLVSLEPASFFAPPKAE
jgi:hypothetical protein